MNTLLFVSPFDDVYLNIACERALAQCQTPSVMLWSNDNAVVMGKHQYAPDEVDLIEAKRLGVKLARRYSGGGAVYHDLNNLNYTFICPSSKDAKSDNYNLIIYTLSQLGIEVTQNGRNDILCNGRKVSGNAYYWLNGNFIHHGTLLLNTNVEVMNKVLTPDLNKLMSHGVKSVANRVANLTQFRSDITKEMFSEVFCSALCKDRTVTTVDFDFFDGKALERQREFLSSNQWLYGFGRQAFCVKGETLSLGRVELTFSLDNGVIKGLQIFSDSLLVDEVDRAKTELNGWNIGVKPPCDKKTQTELLCLINTSIDTQQKVI